MSAPHAETEPDLRDRAASLVEPIAINPGTRIGRYVVLSKLGAGGMGVVLAAYDPQLDRRVALKVLHPSREHKEREARRLLREAMAMARLTHPNVITVHDVGEHEKLVYISMELVEGGTLEQKLATRPPWPEVLELFIAAGRGLAAAHAKGLVHRDFKPENVMVGDDGRVRVMDFGLAHDAVTDSGTATPSGSDDAPVPIAAKRSLDTHAGRIAGTPGFISPELHRGEPADARSDQFAFGVALYEGLFGERPFVGETIFAVAASTMAGQVREISAKSPVPGWVRRIVLRALSVNPIDRFPTMDALLDALAQHDVRRRRRQIAIAVGGVLGLVGGAAGTSLFLAHRAHARCESAAAAIEASWNDEIRASTRAGFVRDAPEFAAIAFDKSAEWIDGWTASWHDARREVCERATIHETLTHALEARALACFDERRRVLDGVIAQLAEGGETITFAAIDATSNLPPVAACTDERALQRNPDVVLDQTTLDVLADADAALLSDRAREGVELARQAAARAATHGMIEVEIDARMKLAFGLVDIGEFADAVAQSEQAFYLAGKNGDDAAAADAAASAASTAAFDQRDIATAQRWIPLAEMSLARFGEDDTPRAADILFALGRAQLGAGDDARAEEQLARTLAIYERELGDAHPRVAMVLVHLGIVATNRGEYERADHFNARALALYEAAFGPEHPKLASTLNNMGNNLDARGKHDEAIALYERALALWEAAFGEAHPQVAEVLSNIAAAHYQKGELAKAMSEGQRALALLERTLGPRSPRVAQCLNNLMNIAASNGDFAEAEAYQQRALEIHEATLPADHPELASSLTQAGLLVAAQPDADATTLSRARSRLERALSIWKQRYGDDHPDSAFALQGLGVVLMRQGELDESIATLEHALRLRTAQDVLRGETTYSLADALRRAHRDPHRARALARESLELYRAAGAEIFAPQIEDAEKFLAAP